MAVISNNTLESGSGEFQAQVFPADGRVAFAGPTLAGVSLGTEIIFEPARITFPGRVVPLGRVIGAVRKSADKLEMDQDLGGAKAITRITFPFEGIMRFEVIDWGGPIPSAASIAAASDTSESFFGFGERFNRLDQAGRFVKIRTFDHAGDKSVPNDPAQDDFAYKSTPWFMSNRGYGFHLDSSVESTFDMRKTDATRYIITQPFIPSRSSGFAWHVISGPKLTDVLSRYSNLSGRPPLPPPWAFGPWISSDAWRNGGEVRYAVTKFIERGIPVSAFVFDSPWEFAYNDFHFNIKDGSSPDPSTQFGSSGHFEDQPHVPMRVYPGFQSLAEMMTFLQTNGLKVICWMAPFVNDESSKNETAGETNEVIKGQLDKAPNFDKGVQLGVFVQSESDGSKQANGSPRNGIHWWKGHGNHIDFTNPAARTWLKNQLDDLIDKSRVMTASGNTEPAVSGFKTDDGEALLPAGSNNNPSGFYLSNNAKYSDPEVTPQEMRNRYCVEYHKAISTILRDKVGSENGLLFSRGGFHGSQAFPGCWAGDNQPNFKDANGLPSVIIAGLSAALSGFSIWGHDIGGYQRDYEPPPTDIDLFIRWAQFGCFTPIMQMHRQLSNPPPNVTHPHGQYPWGYVSNQENADPAKKDKQFVDNEALRNYRFYAKLHTQLFPYIYTHAKQSSETGLPIMRPLVLLHQEDRTTFGINHSYYFGSELLISPLIKPNQTARNVYLPQGRWIDFWTNEQIDRSGGGGNFAWSNADRSKLPVFARAGAIIPMFLDVPQSLCDSNYVNNSQIPTAGTGLLLRIYPAGGSHFLIHDGTDVTCQANGNNTSVTIQSQTLRPVQLVVLASRPVSGVKRDGTSIDEQTDPAKFAAAVSAWRHDGILEIKFAHSGGSTTVTF